MSDIEKILGSVGTQKAPLLVTLSTYMNNRLINIRRYYTDKVTNELKPGKGIALKEDELDFVAELIMTQREIIEAHFTEDLSATEREVRIKNKGKFAALQVQMQRGELELRVGAVSGGELFTSEHRAGKTILTLNESFQCFRDMGSSTIPTSVAKLIGAMLMSVGFNDADDSLKSSYLSAIRNEIKANIR